MSLAIKMKARFLNFYLNSFKMANIGELPHRVLGTAPKFGLREEIEFVPVCLRPCQTTSQKEVQRLVHTGCKEGRATRAKFVVFYLLIRLVSFDVLVAIAVAADAADATAVVAKKQAELN